MTTHQNDHALLLDGKLVPCARPVLRWLDTGLGFDVQRPRRETRFVVLHWTASENTVARVVSSMRERRASVQFIITQEGVIYQTCDAGARASHARTTGNEYGVGIEMINRGHAFHVPQRGVVRTEVTEQIHGRRVTYGLMTDRQMEAALALVGALCGTYALPPMPPYDAQTGDVFAGLLPPKYLAVFRGLLGHFHLVRNRVDPGLTLLRELGRGLAEPEPKEPDYA